MTLIFTFLPWIGLFVLAWRLRRRGPILSDSKATLPSPFVSIIIPVRNEQENLPRLLNSLTCINYSHKEIILVDDLSTDQSREIIRSYSVRLVEGQPLPPGWVGKNWACHQGAAHARGDLFLFTDADTAHAPDGLESAIKYFYSKQADLMSALPFHETSTWWERWLGPFHALLYTATSYLTPQKNRLFAIGQYLLFSKEFYFRIGGHSSIRHQYPDDLALANRCLDMGGRYRVYADAPLYRVRMYSSFWNFIQGWRRNFLAGLQQSSLWAVFDVTAVFFALTGAGRWLEHPATLIPTFLSLALIAAKQRGWGGFSVGGIIFFPFSLAVYTLITGLAFIDYISGNKLNWKGRQYEEWKNQDTGSR